MAINKPLSERELEFIRVESAKAKLCGCGCGEFAKSGNKFIRGHHRRGVSHVGVDNPMWGRRQSELCKQINAERMTGNKYAVGKITPHLSALNRSRVGVPISEPAKIKIGQASKDYWKSNDGIKQRESLSRINQEWAAAHPDHKIVAAKNGHRKCPRISSLERKVEILLREAGVDFIPQYEYELGFMDFLLKPNTALFVNGDYWHNYPDGTEKDKRQLAHLKERGFKTLVIWEHELKNINEVASRIQKFHEVS